jgi:aarF domain-containing kinase
MDEIKVTYESDHGVKIEDVFYDFEPVPIGNASLAQVHRAKLKSTGETVAVKLQYPRLRA